MPHHGLSLICDTAPTGGKTGRNCSQTTSTRIYPRPPRCPSISATFLATGRGISPALSPPSPRLRPQHRHTHPDADLYDRPTTERGRQLLRPLTDGLISGLSSSGSTPTAALNTGPLITSPELVLDAPSSDSAVLFPPTNSLLRSHRFDVNIGSRVSMCSRSLTLSDSIHRLFRRHRNQDRAIRSGSQLSSIPNSNLDAF
ncbi:uncharacterized protein LAESUDRAFT_765057 [Laetiporus sulphureus 93-53]|uniref:Uncharacterized protein n=1 Tax=Laetiporus sulphureus 93-53 TaxID=1314785 RepID=A0A165AZL6_9APHY|nr:uncharacterized protein LAESUDRAFT_765057 [Laetiporus sulphureus 93-53]KZS99950.1 hypothetical protein LAESUDRAFT_765057 [Laetiporus sulphureus 93-53]